MSNNMELAEIVDKAFNNAIAEPTIPRWKSCSVVAGCAAVRMAADGDLLMAAKLNGIADEAHNQMLGLMPKEPE